MINDNRLVKFIRAIVALSVVLTLSACVSRDISDLEVKVENIMSRPGGLIEPLPEIKPYEAYSYESSSVGGRNPFKLFYIIKAPEIDDEKSVDDGLTEEMAREIRNRNREELEQFELDSLRMVGTIDNENNNWGIILDPNGIVHRVKVGNYMGLNIGKIINIHEDKVELREIVQDSEGRWEEREAALALLEE
ncbi:MAG: pilus assembly protein PilP [Proteobacteria bacterium]|nr:pilus assembly protein PilP [Pseudomonadota bacterium]NOG60406.1 pilus assembly protein PilP [Pseudomonadota bacterium]